MGNTARGEQVAMIANRLYSARRSCRTLFGEKYAQRVTDNMRLIQEYDKGKGPVQTGMKMVELLAAGGYEVNALLVMAAIVELCEPDELTPTLEETSS